MKPLQHARKSARRFGGSWEDYQGVHDFLDQTKAHVPDVRHRAILHNSFGIYLCEQMFGTAIKNSDGTLVSVRAVAERHVIEDIGFIPTLSECIKDIPLEPGCWFGGKMKADRRKNRNV